MSRNEFIRKASASCCPPGQHEAPVHQCVNMGLRGSPLSFCMCRVSAFSRFENFRPLLALPPKPMWPVSSYILKWLILSSFHCSTSGGREATSKYKKFCWITFAMAALNFCRKEWDEKRCPSRTKVDQKPWNPKAKVFLVKATWWIAQWIWRAKFLFGWSPGWLCTACVTRWKRASFTFKASPTKHIVCRSTLWKIWRGMPHARKRQPTYPQKQRIQDINSAYKFEVSARSRATIGWCTQNQAAGMSSQSKGFLMTTCCWTLFMTERTSAEPRFPDPSLMFVSSLMLMLITWRMWGSCALKFWGELDCKNKLHTAITNERKYKNTARRLPLPLSALPGPSPWSGTSSTGFHFVLEDAKNSLWKLALAAWSASPSASSVFLNDRSNLRLWKVSCAAALPLDVWFCRLSFLLSSPSSFCPR